jgi:hypothetical protein
MNWNPRDPTALATFDEPRHSETSRANRALCDYCSLGCTRSLEKLLETYASDPAAPTHSLDTLKDWSVNYAWRARSLAFDSNERTYQANLVAERRRNIIETGLALQYERIDKLKFAYAQLEPYISNPNYLWTRFVRKVPTPDGNFEFIETYRFNSELFAQLRGLLSDIARETTGPAFAGTQASLASMPNLKLLTDDELDQMNEILDQSQKRYWEAMGSS